MHILSGISDYLPTHSVNVVLNEMGKQIVHENILHNKARKVCCSINNNYGSQDFTSTPCRR